MDFTAGTQVSAVVRLVRPLGRGGMGAVWVAEHMMLKTEVVVKFMADALASDPVSLARFSREAAAAAAVKSPHVVQMLDHGFTPDGTPFIVMELLEGEDLKTRLVRERVILLDELGVILSQACKALARAHVTEIIHRDIKPENIFLCHTDDGEPFVKLLDFGIAKSGSPTDFHMTQTGVTVGTPFYMSPEQAVGAPPVDATTDLWSLGVVAFECMTGERPFDGPTLGALTMAICSERPPVPSMVDPAIPTEIDAWMAIACARSRTDRFQSAKVMSDAFATALRESTAPRPLLPVSRAVPLAFEATSASQGNLVPARRPSTPPPSLAAAAVVAPAAPAAASSEPQTEPDPEPVSSFGTTTNPLSRTHDPVAGTRAATPQPPPVPVPAAVLSAARPARGLYVAGGAVVLATALAAWVVTSPHEARSPGVASVAASAADVESPAPVAPPTSVPSTTPWLPASSTSPDAASASVDSASRASASSAQVAASHTTTPPIGRPPHAGSAASASSSTTPAPPANCNPPYYIDSAHNKVFKKECPL